MPIRPEEKAKYPADWPAISNHIRFGRAHGYCEECGVPHNAVIKREGARWRVICSEEREMIISKMRNSGYSESGAIKQLGFVRVILTVAHLNHDPADCRDENLKALCQRCHNTYDAANRRAGINERAARDQMGLFP